MILAIIQLLKLNYATKDVGKERKTMNQRQKRIFEFLKNFFLANKYWPSYDEIVSACQTSKGTVNADIQKLIKLGKIIKPANISRSFILKEDQ